VKPDHWARVRAVFDAVCDLAPEAREAAIATSGLDADALPLLRSMLSADAGNSLRDDVASQAPAVIASLETDERPGSRVGPWRIDALIGAGGMGRVYRAHREDGRYEGVVAIKFVAEAANPGFFRHERHVLARLTHPGIARLIDAGEDERGQPYLVMEHVQGLPIDEHCRSVAADARTRIALVIEAARAIAHAHSQWVLHRDLKPANLLVAADGHIKVLDFGIARLLDRESSGPEHTTARYFTPRYAAPEQIAASGTSAAVDLHALAVIAFELLTGAHPCAAAMATGRGLPECLLGGDTTPLRRALDGPFRDRCAVIGHARLRDLEAVLGKALARQPEHRYASVQEFGDELQRVLDDRPVLVRAPSTTEQLLRFARKHRVGVALGMCALIALLAVSAIALRQAHVASVERDLARREAARAEGIAQFLTGLFEAAQPARNQGREPSARDLLDRGREQLPTSAADPALRAAMTVAIADSYRSLGDYTEAETLLKSALDLLAPSDPRRTAWLAQLGRVHNFQARWTDAEQVLRLALDGATQDRAQSAALWRSLAVSLLNQGRNEEAEAAARQSLADLNATPDAATRERVDTEMLLATIAFGRNDLAAAHAAYAAIVAAQRRGGPGDQEGLVTSLNNLAAIELRMDRFEAAVAHYRESIERARARYGANNREVALPLLGLGSALRGLGRFDEALAALGESRAIFAEWSGDRHPETAYASLLLAELHWLLGQPEAARADMAGVAASLAGENPTSVKACRADLVELALLERGEQPSARQLAAGDCLQPIAPPNVQLLTRYVVQLRAAPGTVDVEALRRAAQTLVPRDAALAQAIERDFGSHR
jgi:serine/threonine-protein kinase